MDRTFRKLCRSEQMESDEDKLKWLRVRLVGKALTVYRRLGQSARQIWCVQRCVTFIVSIPTVQETSTCTQGKKASNHLEIIA